MEDHTNKLKSVLLNINLTSLLLVQPYAIVPVLGADWLQRRKKYLGNNKIKAINVFQRLTSNEFGENKLKDILLLTL